MSKYLISIDQSTQGTKMLLFNEDGKLVKRLDLPHQQIISDAGWVSHDVEEIYANVISLMQKMLEQTGIKAEEILGLGISNQRETSVAWDRETGKSLAHAVVWQCARAAAICDRVEAAGHAEMIKEHTGMNLSPYFPASKFAWLLENVPAVKEAADAGRLCFGTIDAWLIYRLTGGKSYKTDLSNAARTQLFNIHTLSWDPEICEIFGIPMNALPEVVPTDAEFGFTSFDGTLTSEIPIHSAMGDSNGALFGQGCVAPGMVKSTYGTGSSIMMNIGEKPLVSKNGLVTSIAWGIDGVVNYVFEGNLNYTGASITWLKDDLQLIRNAGETEELARQAVQDDTLYLVPAFSGLGAPYWDSYAKAAFIGMSRTTGWKELVRAGVESIAYQITDVLQAMADDAGTAIEALRVDGGPTHNGYLMQFQADIARTRVQIPDAEELSGIGAAYVAGIALGFWDKNIAERMGRREFAPAMDPETRDKKYHGWQGAVRQVLAHD